MERISPQELFKICGGLKAMLGDSVIINERRVIHVDIELSERHGAIPFNIFGLNLSLRNGQRSLF